MNEYEFPDKKVAGVQGQLEKLVEKNYYLNRSAKDAYRSYLLSYASHSLKHIFNVGSLDLVAVSKGFGFAVPPRVNINVSATGSGGDAAAAGAASGGKRGGGGFAAPAKRHASEIADPKKRAAALMRLQKGSGHSFSASNPYGKREAGDGRQFSH